MSKIISVPTIIPVTRRDFLKGAGALAVMSAFGGLAVPSKARAYQMCSAPAANVYSDILSYWDMETDALNKPSTWGNATYGGGGALSTSQHAVGAKSLSIADQLQSKAYFAYSGHNISEWFGLDEGAVGAYVYVPTAFVDQVFIMQFYVNSQNQIYFLWNGTAGHIYTTRIANNVGVGLSDVTTGITPDTWAYVEYHWSVSKALPDGHSQEFRVNGVTVASTTTTLTSFSAGTNPTSAQIGNYQGGASNDFYMDQFLGTNDPNRDLYA
ncbi:MAG: twin-arginine translocation signal domain-containing protein, partial [Gallionella sp.]